jgi:hypothetical protein
MSFFFLFLVVAVAIVAFWFLFSPERVNELRAGHTSTIEATPSPAISPH